ncbi:MAG: V-type ATP synthase subunit A [Candidatus Ancaeobacter aquaticus]|nr:V-type ATP synthase subunit A [Candidatus Ancaeobacter aquaticus]
MNNKKNDNGHGLGKSVSARVVTVRDNIVQIEVLEGSIKKNEVGYVCVGDERLRAEVLRITGKKADMQVFEDTGGVRVGDTVEMTGQMLSIELGPGLLGQVFDGLQNPLNIFAKEYGFFLPRGRDVRALDTNKKWRFTPSVKVGETVKPGGVIGTTMEGIFVHKIMVPFKLKEPVTVKWIQKESEVTLDDKVAKIETTDGKEQDVTLTMKWPVRKAIPERLLRERFVERLYPEEPMTTTIRIVDAFFPIARGGTACIPGPFGAGKTVLQGLMARYSTVDIVIIIACGERAGEVVETITEYPSMKDPKTGGSLMDRTIIICNTSSMPVAARESSLYTGITMGEYYRQMGYNVLVIADSTSRWAQAMRETSGRMEEIPGEEAFPAYLDSSVKNVYERAGVIRTADGSVGSLTMVGTVSPAGGNFEEPVTQATLSTVKTFLGLSYDRAYKRFYPAINPLISWSRYLHQLEPWFTKNLGHTWVQDIKDMYDLFVQADNINQLMQVTGEEGITVEDYLLLQKSTLVDIVYLQQDAYDPVDVSVSRERQLESFSFLKYIIYYEYSFENKDVVREFFTQVTGLYKNLNYSPFKSKEYEKYKKEIEDLVRSSTTKVYSGKA